MLLVVLSVFGLQSKYCFSIHELQVAPSEHVRILILFKNIFKSPDATNV